MSAMIGYDKLLKITGDADASVQTTTTTTTTTNH
jgi:hypothetical protein